eukprot:1402539-Rhodomonas_salina.10
MACSRSEAVAYSTCSCSSLASVLPRRSVGVGQRAKPILEVASYAWVQHGVDAAAYVRVSTDVYASSLAAYNSLIRPETKCTSAHAQDNLYGKCCVFCLISPRRTGPGLPGSQPYAVSVPDIA